MALCIVAQAQPTAVKAADYTPVSSACSGSHSGWTALTQTLMDSYLDTTSFYLAAYYLPAGKYYLSENISVSNYNITVEGSEGNTQFSLCLNGKYLKMEGSNMFQKEQNSSGLACDIHICDCKPTSTAIKGYIDANGRWNLGTSIPSGATAYNLTGGALIGDETIIVQSNQKCIITGGNLVGSNDYYEVIELNGSEHHLKGCKIIGNVVDDAIISATNAQLNLYGNVIFEKNISTGTSACIHISGGSANIENCTFKNNKFTYGLIGASNGAVVNVTGGTYTNNAADQAQSYQRYAGAFYLSGGQLNLSNITISNNIGNYGVIYANKGTLNLNNVTISNNIGNYGVIYANKGTLNLNNVTISQNTGAYSGGIYISGSANATFTNVTVTNNTTTKTDGTYGAVYIGNSDVVNVGGKVVINGNTGNNLYSYKTSLQVVDGNPLTTDSKIGFKFYTGSATKPVTMITALKNAQENDNHIINEMDTTLYSQRQDGSDVIIYKEFTLSYDANGASGVAPESVTGTGAAVTVADNTFTALYFNYAFMGWATTPDGEVAYVPGDTLTITEDTILYAVWQDVLNDKLVVELGEPLLYSGEEQTQEVAVFFDGTQLVEGTDYDVADNKATDLGTYTLTITFKGNYCGSATKDFTLSKVLLAKPVADDTLFVYNGSAQTYQLTQNEFYTITNNVQTNAGDHTVTVSLIDTDRCAWEDNSIQDLTYTFVIAKATYDMTGVVFEDSTAIYTGSVLTIQATNLPNGVSVTYENNKNVIVGTYTVTAKFSGDTHNYHPIEDMTATLTINKGYYDMTVLSLKTKL